MKVVFDVEHVLDVTNTAKPKAIEVLISFLCSLNQHSPMANLPHRVTMEEHEGKLVLSK